MSSFRAVVLFVACLRCYSVELDPISLSSAFEQDDECEGNSECALNALQLRGQRETPNEWSPYMSEYSDDALYINDLPEGWNASDIDDDFGKDNNSNADDEMKTEVQLGRSYCPSNPGARSCYLYRVCQHRSYCVLSGYMIVPGWACQGTEDINGGNAGKFDYLMRAAKNHCSDTHCVLITNPTCCRTQEQLHIHYRHYNGGGAALKSQLEHTLCHSHGWTYFNKCGAGKARIYDYFPDVFSEVAKAYGGGNLGHVGIAVWFTKACGGFKTIILTTTDCSIEHSISSR